MEDIAKYTPRRVDEITKKRSNAESVKEFTEGASRSKCPDVPEPMNIKELEFLCKNKISEMIEMIRPVYVGDPKEFMKHCVDLADVNLNYVKPTDSLDIVAEQMDAAIDDWYYTLNAFCKKGSNLSKIFDIVHQANMAKKFPDGTFHHREDGKVIKPDNWQEPDIKLEVQKQILYGAWD